MTSAPPPFFLAALTSSTHFPISATLFIHILFVRQAPIIIAGHTFTTNGSTVGDRVLAHHGGHNFLFFSVKIVSNGVLYNTPLRRIQPPDYHHTRREIGTWLKRHKIPPYNRVSGSNLLAIIFRKSLRQKSFSTCNIFVGEELMPLITHSSVLFEAL